MRKTTRERFEEKYIPVTETGCWLWTGSQTEQGYGHIRINNITVIAHRFSWFLYHGRIEKDICVLHKCDVPSCVNPEHLFLGTRKDNVRDCIKKDRRASAKGENNNAAKLTHEDVVEIRDLNRWGMNYAKIGRFYNLTGISVKRVCNYETWRRSKSAA